MRAGAGVIYQKKSNNSTIAKKMKEEESVAMFDDLLDVAHEQALSLT